MEKSSEPEKQRPFISLDDTQIMPILEKKKLIKFK